MIKDPAGKKSYIHQYYYEKKLPLEIFPWTLGGKKEPALNIVRNF